MAAKITAKTPAVAKLTVVPKVMTLKEEIASTKPTMLTPMPGSKKAKVYDRFKKDGDEAAFAYGRKNLHCTEGTLRTWIGAWKRCNVKPRPEMAAAA